LRPIKSPAAQGAGAANVRDTRDTIKIKKPGEHVVDDETQQEDSTLVKQRLQSSSYSVKRDKRDGGAELWQHLRGGEANRRLKGFNHRAKRTKKKRNSKT